MKIRHCHPVVCISTLTLSAVLVSSCALSEQNASVVETTSYAANSTQSSLDSDQQSFDLIAVVVGFVLGILTRLIPDTIQRHREKMRLIAVFLADINRNWGDVDRTRLHPRPRSSQGARVVYGYRGVDGIEFLHDPEYEYEVHNLELYETEGFKLVQYLGSKARVKFWDVYTLLRNAEATRLIIKSLGEDAADREAYRCLFVSLVSQLSDAMIELWELLSDEQSWFFKVVRKAQLTEED